MAKLRYFFVRRSCKYNCYPNKILLNHCDAKENFLSQFNEPSKTDTKIEDIWTDTRQENIDLKTLLHTTLQL